jgi:hypothetical protein
MDCDTFQRTKLHPKYISQINEAEKLFLAESNTKRKPSSGPIIAMVLWQRARINFCRKTKHQSQRQRTDIKYFNPKKGFNSINKFNIQSLNTATKI